MTERGQFILKLVVEDVVKTGEPVGSRSLVEKYRLDVSPATVRNVFAELEREGYLTHPHTSAGRVPTEKGYRFYLQELMRTRELRKRESEQLRQAQNAEELARAVAELTGSIFLMMRGARRLAYKTGFSNLLAQPEFSNRDLLVRVGEMLDNFHRVAEELDVEAFQNPTALIGPDNPFDARCGAVFVRLPNGGVAAVLGPMRMDYARIYSVLNGAKDLFDSYDE